MEKIEIFFCVYIGSNKQANMNYKTALKQKVMWEKSFRPHIKDYLIPNHTRINQENTIKMNSAKDCICKFNALIEVRDKPVGWCRKEVLDIMLLGDCLDVAFSSFFTLGLAPSINEEMLVKRVFEDGFLEFSIKELNTTIDGLTLAIKQSKKEIVLLSYIYNVDVENTLKHFEEWKKMSYMSQEWWEENHEGKGIDVNENGETHNDENAYIEFMNREKEIYEIFQNLIALVKRHHDIVKPILKAGKRMNKRNGKKNRG